MPVTKPARRVPDGRGVTRTTSPLLLSILVAILDLVPVIGSTIGNGLGTFLEVSGELHPYFRPFLSRRGTGTMSFWLNTNLTGSFAPSSIRTTPRKVIEVLSAQDLSFEEEGFGAAVARLVDVNDGLEQQTSGQLDDARRC